MNDCLTEKLLKLKLFSSKNRAFKANVPFLVGRMYSIFIDISQDLTDYSDDICDREL